MFENPKRDRSLNNLIYISSTKIILIYNFKNEIDQEKAIHNLLCRVFAQGHSASIQPRKYNVRIAS